MTSDVLIIGTCLAVIRVELDQGCNRMAMLPIVGVLRVDGFALHVIERMTSSAESLGEPAGPRITLALRLG
jgi:hypothetical protein